MSDVVQPMVFPYKPNGGFSYGEIWGSPKPAYDKTLPAAETLESQKRWQDLAFNTVETILDRYKAKYIAPANYPETNYRAGITPGKGTESEPAIIRISGTAAPSKQDFGIWLLVGGALVVMFALSRAGR